MIEQYIVLVGIHYKHVRCTNSKLQVLYTRDPPAKWTAVSGALRLDHSLNTKIRQMPTKLLCELEDTDYGDVKGQREGPNIVANLHTLTSAVSTCSYNVGSHEANKS